MRGVQFFLVMAATLVTTGCVGMTATPAVQGKAYVVDGHLFGTSMYNCEAKDGEPVCYEVEQVEID